nr:hypothetical protein [Paraburkholderia sp. BL8N3]
MTAEFRGSLPDDISEWIRILSCDDGRAAREQLALGNPIYYRENDTPTGFCIKKYPDGSRDLVTFHRETGEEVVVLKLLSAVEQSTREANEALDDALTFIAASNARISRLNDK